MPSLMSQKSDFTVVYDGDALREHSMDVRDLAPALMSLGQLVDRVNVLCNEDKAAVRLDVRALETGSFEIALELSQSLIAQATQFLTGDFVVSAINLKELIFGAGVTVSGLWWLYKFLKGRKPDKVERLGDGRVSLTVDGDTHVFPLRLLRLYEDMAVRKAVEDVLRPLDRTGIDSFVVRDSGRIIASTSKEERIYFASQPEKLEDELLSSREYEGVFAIVAPVFKDDNKWRLSDGNTGLNVVIADKDFLERVDSRKESFYKGDLLRCIIQTKQWQTQGGLRTEHEVKKVVEHIQSGIQLNLFNLANDIPAKDNEGEEQAED